LIHEKEKAFIHFCRMNKTTDISANKDKGKTNGNGNTIQVGGAELFPNSILS